MFKFGIAFALAARCFDADQSKNFRCFIHQYGRNTLEFNTNRLKAARHILTPAAV
ncbi:hypothetical protein [uncultured Campylobacter sp.]|uniref:hypothetical protein n=1 Tax=uncultured Campylobacter sp. TaxID=218934 RepID=UPI0026236AA2|nr:hypothetical protein [uncultured Campylobacter sp.]